MKTGLKLLEWNTLFGSKVIAISKDGTYSGRSMQTREIKEIYGLMGTDRMSGSRYGKATCIKWSDTVLKAGLETCQQ